MAVEFVIKDGSRVPVKGRVGQNLLRLAHEHKIDLEGARMCAS